MTTPPDQGGPVTWQVTAQQQGVDVSDAGNVVRGITVYFTTGKGHNGSVFVPDSQYTPDRVRALVADKAARMDAIGSLTS